MNKRLSAAILLIALTGTLHAAPESTPVQVTANERIDPDVPFQVKPMGANDEGVEITFLVVGEDLSEFKEDSLTLSAINAGKDVKLPPNLAKRVKFEKFHTAVSEDGTYGRFTLKIPVQNAAKVAKSLKLSGTVVAYSRGQTETTPAATLPAENAPAVTAGAFKISRGKGPGGFFNMGNTNEKSLGVTITGPLSEMKELVVTSGGKTLKSNSRMSSGDTAGYGFPDWDGKSPVTVSVVIWKNRPETVIPFTFGS